MQKDLTPKLKLFGGISNLGYYMVVYFHSYLLFFILSDVMKLPLAYVATITGISGLVSALLTPASGFIIDRTKAGKHGRYRKLLLVWPIIYIFYLWTGYTRLSSNDIVATAILTVCLTFTQFGASLTGAIKNTLLAHISKDSETRALLMGRNTMWGGIGTFVYSLTITSILAFFANFTSVELSYPLTETFFCLILVLTALIEFSMTKGYDLTANVDTDTGKVRVKDDRPSFKEMMKNVFTNLPLGVQMVTTLCVALTSGYVSSMLIYYYTYVAESKSLYTLHLTIVSFFMIASGIVMPILAKKLTNKFTVIAGLSACIIGLLICLFGGVGSAYAFMIGACLTTFGCQMCTAVSYANYGDCSVYAEWKTGVNSLGTIMNMATVSGMISNFLKSIVLSTALAMSGYVAGEVADMAVKTGIVRAFSLVPLVVLTLSFVLFLFGYKLTNSKVKEMQEELNARKTAV